MVLRSVLWNVRDFATFGRRKPLPGAPGVRRGLGEGQREQRGAGHLGAWIFCVRRCTDCPNFYPITWLYIVNLPHFGEGQQAKKTHWYPHFGEGQPLPPAVPSPEWGRFWPLPSPKWGAGFTLHYIEAPTFQPKQKRYLPGVYCAMSVPSNRSMNFFSCSSFTYLS